MVLKRLEHPRGGYDPVTGSRWYATDNHRTDPSDSRYVVADLYDERGVFYRTARVAECGDRISSGNFAAKQNRYVADRLDELLARPWSVTYRAGNGQSACERFATWQHGEEFLRQVGRLDLLSSIVLDGAEQVEEQDAVQ